MKFVLFSVLYFLVVANLQSANCEEEYYVNECYGEHMDQAKINAATKECCASLNLACKLDKLGNNACVAPNLNEIGLDAQIDECCKGKGAEYAVASGGSKIGFKSCP